MAKLRRDKIALFLACASFLGGKTQAAQNVKTGQTVAAVGGEAALKNNKNTLSAMDKSKNATDLSGRKIENKSFINKAVDWIKAKPGKAAAIGAGVITAATAAIALPMLLCKGKNPSKPQKLEEDELKKNGNGNNNDGSREELKNQVNNQGNNQDNNQENYPEVEDIVSEDKKKEEKADINNNKNERNDEKNENISHEGQGKIIEKKIETESNPAIVQKPVVADNTKDIKYAPLDWNKVKFSSNDGYAAKTATMIGNDEYLKSLKESYDIKKNFTAGIVNNVYDGSWYKASLIVIDCNCNEFCKKGALKDKNGNPSAYCNGRGQIFILNKGDVSMNYGTKGTGGKWTLEEKDNKYCVDWHTS